MSGQRTRQNNLGFIASVCVALAFVPTVIAQTDGTYLITFDGVVTPQTPTMTVSIWATWRDPRGEYVFGGGYYDLEAGDGEFVRGKLILGLDPPNSLGVLSGGRVIGAAIGQIHLPGHFIGDPSNPILLATYEWKTTDFTPRTIDFATSNTTHFIVSEYITGATTNLVPNQFTPGSAQYFVPAPSTLALLGLGGLIATRRRRIGSMNDV